MTRDEAIFIILGRCGQRQNDTVLQRACVTELILAQTTKLERAAFKPRFLISENETTETIIGQERVTLPRYFLGEVEESALWIRDYDESGLTQAQWFPLLREDFDEADLLYNGLGRPAVYSVVGNYFTLFPAPDKIYELKMRYYKAGVLIPEPYNVPGDVVTNVWLTNAPDWLIGEAGAVVAGMYLKDAATAQAFQAQADAARQALYVQTVADEEVNRLRSMGDD